jgi:adenylate kinase family enzyme
MDGIRRVMILGQPGSGKSTLARDIGRITGLPVVHIDHIHWQSGWIERSMAEKSRLCREIEGREAWVFEGGHSATWKTRLARAELVIWLDFPVSLRLWRIVKRTFVWMGRNRPDLPEGCTEGFHSQTLPFWHYVWRTRQSARTRIGRLIDRAGPDKPVVWLQTPQAVRAFLSSLQQGGPFSFGAGGPVS